MSKSPSASPLPFHPWIYFFIFLTANTLLSYFTFSTETNLWIGFLGLALPFGLAWWTNRSSGDSHTPLYQIEFFKKIPIWVWLLIGAAAIFFRFYKLTTLSAWPTFDEGMFGFTAIQMNQKGVDRLFYMFSDIPVFYPWFLSLVFKLFGPSLFNFCFWPAVFSTLGVPLVYLAARQYFSKSFSFFCLLLAALAFWPCYSGRFCENEVLIFPWEALVFLWLGKCAQSSSPKGDRFAALLGLSLGLAFYAVYLHWMSVTLIVVFTMIFLFGKERPSRLIWFALGLALPVIPFVILSVQTGGVNYLHSQSILTMAEPWIKKIQWAWNTPHVLFWGAVYEEVCYRPVWGGLINPLLGALFGVGLLEILKNLKNSLYLWLLISFFIFLLPGALSLGFEFFRIIPILVVLIPVIGLGWARLTQAFSLRWSTVILLALMIPSLLLDAYQLLGVYPRLWDNPSYWLKEVKSINNYRAYQILKSKSLSDGPGFVFADFIPSLDDQTLNLADYSFNAVNNSRLDGEKAKWAAVMINVNYQPFLAKRFGKGTIYWLSKDLNAADGGWMLWIIDINETNRPVFRQWQKASQSLNDYLTDYFQGTSPAGNRVIPKVLDTLNQIGPQFAGDPFLESCYAEKKADLLYKTQGAAASSQYLIQALPQGYPAAHLFYRLGTLQLLQHQEAEARRTFQKALHAPINFTQSAQFLNSTAK